MAEKKKWTEEYLRYNDAPQAQPVRPEVAQAAAEAAQSAAGIVQPKTGSLTGDYLGGINAGAEAQKYLDLYRNNQYNYDVNMDPTYLQARENAMRQGQLAAKNVQGQAAALTGGYGNSYATAAAQQQYNQYLQGVNDMVPELEANAYNRWQNEQNRNMSLAQMYLDMENQQYNRDLTKAQLGAAYGDYSGINAMGINTEHYESREAADRAWEELQREHEQTVWDQDALASAMNIAMQAAQYGDYSKLEEMGYDMSTQQRRDQLEEAMIYAQYNDYSKLRALGFDVSLLEAQKAKCDEDVKNTELPKVPDYDELNELTMAIHELALQE